MSDDLFIRARAKLDVGEFVGVKSSAAKWTQLRGVKRPCPICDGHDCFSFKPSGWRCHATGEKGDVIDFAARSWGVSPFAAACRALGLDEAEQRKAYAQDKAPRDVKRAAKPVVRKAAQVDAIDRDVEAVIDRIALTLVNGAGTLVEDYLASRALPRAFARHALFCADAPYDMGAAFGRGRSFSAMVFFVEHGGVKTGGLHVTYFDPAVREKSLTPSLRPAALKDGEPRKKMWGPQKSASGLHAGIVLIRPEPGALLCVAEGVENALAMCAIAGHGAGAFAAGSLNRFQGGMAQTPWGAVDWLRPAPDPEQPAASMRHRGPVLLGTDGDMKPITVNRGSRWERVIDPARRQQVSGVLAAYWWKRAGATDVRVLTTPAGKDANDVLREAAA
jgi:hypothetical protein